MSCVIRPVKTSDIDIDSRRYFLSTVASEEQYEQLYKSIQRDGLLSPPLLYQDDDLLYIVSGLNRIKAAMDCGIHELEALVCEAFTGDQWLRIIRRRIHDGRIGIIGRMKAVQMLVEEQGLSPETDDLDIPGLPAYNQWISLYRIIAGMPAELINYCDAKDVSFRVLQDMVTMPASVLAGFTRMLPLKVNILKQLSSGIAELLYREAVTEEALSRLFEDPPQKQQERESVLVAEIDKMLNPEITALRQKADELKKRIEKPGLSLRYPENFEGNAVQLSLRITTASGVDLLEEFCRDIPREPLRELLDLL